MVTSRIVLVRPPPRRRVLDQQEPPQGLEAVVQRRLAQRQHASAGVLPHAKPLATRRPLPTPLVGLVSVRHPKHAAVVRRRGIRRTSV